MSTLHADRRTRSPWHDVARQPPPPPAEPPLHVAERLVSVILIGASLALMALVVHRALEALW